MKIELKDHTIDVFSVFPRVLDYQMYMENLCEFSQWDEVYGASGMLLFVGNDTVVDQSMSIFRYLSNSSSPSPLIAVNPSYMHPFTLARMINSASNLFDRKIYLNLITGSGGTKALGDNFEHDKRYDRLVEYAICIRLLLDQSQLVNYSGEFYQLQNLQLRPVLPEHL